MDDKKKLEKDCICDIEYMLGEPQASCFTNPPVRLWLGVHEAQRKDGEPTPTCFSGLQW